MKKVLTTVILASIVLLGLMSPNVQADVNDFVVNDFQAEYIINNDAVGGSLDTTEYIDLTYSDNNHGILRAVPASYRSYDTKLKVLGVQRDGAPEKYVIEDQGSNKIIKIGDPNLTITGKHRYKIHYTQERIINFADGKQSFYWDVNGTDWDQPFEKVGAKVLVRSASYAKQASQCYTGGNQSKDQFCTVNQDGKYLQFATTKPLSANENMSIEIFFDGSTFTEPSSSDAIKDVLPDILLFILGLLPGLAVFFIWLGRGRDSKGRGIVIPEYEPPKGMSPAEVGMIADFSVDGKDVSATIIDLAIRGNIRIHDDSKKILFFKNRSFSLELVEPSITGLLPYEATLLQAIFDPYTAGTIIGIDSIDKQKMHSAVESMRKQIESNMTDSKGLIDRKSAGLSKVVAWSGVGLIAVAFFIPFSASMSFGLFVSGIICILFGLIIKKRSVLGVQVNDHIKGLYLYMNTAEKDRLKMMQSVDRPYAEPSKTVELFEKLLPFAVALGVEKSWSKQFDSILTQAPSWYTGNSISSFNAGYLGSSLSNASTLFSKGFEASSGSSGGSGGGGGGGGGGGW